MFPEALVGGLHATPPPKERAGTRVAGQEYPASAQGAPQASSCSLPGALRELHPQTTLWEVCCPSQGTQTPAQVMDPEQGHSSQLCYQHVEQPLTSCLSPHPQASVTVTPPPL